MNVVAEPFLICGLPRSRTAWLAGWLRGPNGARSVGHDVAVECNGMGDFLAVYGRGAVGTVETGAAIAGPALRRVAPRLRLLTIRRDRSAVLASLASLIPEAYSYESLATELELRDRQLDWLESEAGAERVEFDELQDVNCCSWLWEWATGETFDFNWWQVMSGTRVVIDFPLRWQRLQERAGELALAKLDVEKWNQPDGPNWTQIGWEPWTQLEDEIQELAQTHHEEAAQAPLELHLPTVRQLAAVGLFHVMAARVNQRLVGYLTWTIRADPEAGGQRTADQGGWFILPSARGLGRRLMNESLATLRANGITRFEFHHTPNGRGAKLAPWFRRLGAREFQRRYLLET